MPPEDAAYLLDMLQAAQAIARYVENKSHQQYMADEILRDAIERRIEILGEAARKISDSFKLAHPEIPWRKIVAQRHVIAHDYGEIDHAVLWTVATVHVPDLINQLKPLVPAPPADPEPQ
jgi:uncharacterized protein with HEPN domain